MYKIMDLEEYIRLRLAEIEEIEERRYAKEVLLEGLLPVLQTTEKRYLDLEDRVKREIKVPNEQYTVSMLVVQKSDYDVINETLFPVCQEFLQDEGMPVIYFTGDAKQKKELDRKKKLDAIDKDGNRHKLGIRKAECCRRAIRELYDVFAYNKIRWRTVNTAYLDRFYEIYPLEDDIDVSEWQPDYGEMGEWIRDDMMPLWNIEKFRFQCRKFMVPCVDDKYYEHELDLRQYDLNSGYMLGINEDVLSVRYEKDKIIMTSLKESFRDWTAYRFVENPDTSSQGYKGILIGNQRNDSFAQSFTDRQEVPFFSRTELFRIAQGFTASRYVELTDCTITENKVENEIQADMNPFIGDQVFPMEERRNLVLKFRERERGFLFSEDIVRFFVSQMQLSLYEYRCVGILERESS